MRRAFVAFVDGAVDANRRRDQGGAGFGGTCAVIAEYNPEVIVGTLVSALPWHPGSVGAFVGDHGKKVGSDEAITNNTMELLAVWTAARRLHVEIEEGAEVHIYTDSQYAKGSLRWDSDWKGASNRRVIDKIRGEYTAKPAIRIHHVRGHWGVSWNELANLGATKAVALRRGFTGHLKTKISLPCFFCQRFACEDPTFGTKTSHLHDYAAPPCRRERYEPFPSVLIEDFPWTGINPLL